MKYFKGREMVIATFFICFHSKSTNCHEGEHDATTCSQCTHCCAIIVKATSLWCRCPRLLSHRIQQDMAKFRLQQRPKRKFSGNRYTTNNSTKYDLNVAVSASEVKLGHLDRDCELPPEDVVLQGNRIMDVGILSSVFASLACQECKNISLKLEERAWMGCSGSASRKMSM